MLQPADIDIPTKNIAVLPFKKDKKTGLAGHVETYLTKVYFNRHAYFNVVNHRDIKQILKEQKRQKNGLYNDSTIEVGELMGAGAIISGEILAITQKDQHHKENRKKCEKKKCREYTVSCKQRKISVAANMRITDLTFGKIFYSNSPLYSISRKHCTDDNVILPTKENAAPSIAKNIAEDFVKKLSPHYISSSVTLLDSEDIDYTDREEDLLKHGLKYLQQNRLDKAEQLLSKLLASTHSKSYVAAYNLGVIKESQGQLQAAKKYYTLADALQIEPVEAINKAVMRIRTSLYKRKSAIKQVNRHTK